MDGGIVRWMDGGIDGWIDRQMDVWMDRLVSHMDAIKKILKDFYVRQSTSKRDFVT